MLDALTSDFPTFPYTAEENERFIDILQRGKGGFRSMSRLPFSSLNWFSAEHAPSAYVTTYVARLWVTVGK